MALPQKVILGVSGSIAAYKSATLVRQFVKAGVDVQVLMTQSATGFISPLTLSTLSKRPVFSDVHAESAWNNHVELGLWAEAFVVAPATANTLAKLANGLCDNILSAVYLSARCPVFVAPAMDVDMWRHPATQGNLRRLTEQQVQVIPVGYGELASGLVGDGRMAEPEDILRFVEQAFSAKNTLSGKRFLVTAGPTYEPIDPVRFIGNHSSGKMGIAIADALARMGGHVDLVLGPTHLMPEQPAVQVHPVQSAQQMFEACEPLFPDAHAAVLAAAVADYRPAAYAERKIKKSDDELHIPLARTTDIAATLGARKKAGQLLIGFALETDNELAHAEGKLLRKNFDFIVLNSLRDEGAGFGHDTNKVTILRADGSLFEHPLKSKKELAVDIAAEISRLMH